MGQQNEHATLRRQLAAAEERLRASEARQQSLMGSLAQASWEADAGGAVFADSPSWRDYTGQTIEQMLGYGWLDAVHPDDRAFAERQWREAIEAGTAVDAEFRLLAPDGGWRWTNVRAAPVLDNQGVIEQWAGINLDIDTRKRTEAALRESEENYRTLFDSIDEGFAEIEFITNDGGAVVDWRYLKLNPAFTRLTGLADVTGRLISDIVPDLEPVWAERYTQLLTGGEPLRFEEYTASHDMWLDVYVTLVGSPRARRAVQLYSNITARKKAEAALRESEERQAFLLKLSDVLRPLADPVTIEGMAAQITMEHFGADRCYYCTIKDGEAVIVRDAHRAGLSSVVGRYPLSSFPLFERAVERGAPFVVDDLESTDLVDDALKAICRGLQVISFMIVPVMKAGAAVGLMPLVQTRPRQWTRPELDVLSDVAERTWASVERARAEAALGESEERFRQFATASSDILWMRNARTLEVEFVSPAIRTVFGVAPEEAAADARILTSIILPEDRDGVLRNTAEVLAGQPVVHEYRIRRPSDVAFRWIKSTGFPLLDDAGEVVRIAGISQDITDAKIAIEHQGVLLAELQHRVRNILAMIRSMVRRSADGAAEVVDYEARLEGRLLALARVQTLLTSQANSGGSLRDIVESEVSVQAHHGGQFELVGPDVHLSPKAVEVLTLALHELATNALKYGALSTPAGRLRVEWTPFEKRSRPWLSVDWIETGAPSRGPITRRGFGSDLIEGKIPYELGGTGRITIEPGGARCRLEFPLKEGESILETDAPSPTTIFGGVLDMAGAPDLTGRSVLVVEDDYYLAGDTAAALRGAGATVLGPCPSEDATLDLLEKERRQRTPFST